MKTLSKMAAAPIAAVAGRVASGLAGRVGGAAKGAIGNEFKSRALQKIPIIGSFVPQTKAQKVQGVATTANNIRGGGASSINAARSAAIPQPPPPPPMPKQAMLNAYRTYDDMEELSKAAGFGEAFKEALPGYAAGAALTALTLGAGHGARKLHQKYESGKVFRRLKRENPDLVNSREGRENFEVLKRFSPHIAGNVTTARSYLQRAQQTGMVPHEFVKDLTQIQSTADQGGPISDFARGGSGYLQSGSSHAKLKSDMAQNEIRNKASDRKAELDEARNVRDISAHRMNRIRFNERNRP